MQDERNDFGHGPVAPRRDGLRQRAGARRPDLRATAHYVAVCGAGGTENDVITHLVPLGRSQRRDLVTSGSDGAHNQDTPASARGVQGSGFGTEEFRRREWNYV